MSDKSNHNPLSNHDDRFLKPLTMNVIMKRSMTAISLVILLTSFYFGFNGQPTEMGWGMVAFLALLFFANIDRIKTLKASPTGIEAQTWEVINEAKSTIAELQLLARRVAELSLSLVMRSGRLGGFSDDEKEAHKAAMLDVLRQIGVKESEFPKILADWHRFVEFDYVYYLMCLNPLKEMPKEAREEWKQLSPSVDRIPAPEELSDVLKKYNIEHASIDDWITDYEHYRKTRTHRRPAVWRQRQEEYAKRMSK